MTLDESARRILADALAQHGLASFTERLLPHVRPCFALVPDGDDDYARTGNSRLFGDPDVPEDFAWPATRGDWPGPGAQLFLAQIDLAALPLPCADLPREGVLSFYVDGVDGCGPIEVDVHYFAPGTKLVRRAHPVPAWEDGAQCPAIRVAITTGASVPWRARELSALFNEMRDLVGWAAVYECEQTVRGAAIGALLGDIHGFGSRDPRDELVRERGAAEWRALLRVDAQEDAGFYIHPADAIVFLVRASSLARADFSEAAGCGCSAQ